MFRASAILRTVSTELLNAFECGSFGNSSEMLKTYGAMMAPVRQLKATAQKLKEGNVQLEWDIAQDKALNEEQKAAKAAEVSKNLAEIQKLNEEFAAVGKVLKTAVFEKAMGQLARDMPPQAYSLAEEIGNEMNELKVPSSPAFVTSLRKVYFGDTGNADSELLFRYIERPASMFVVTGNVKDMLKKLPDLFEQRGSQPFEERLLDRSKFEEMNEVDNERKLLAQLAAQK